MAKLIPLTIKRDDAGFGQYDVLNRHGEILGTFGSRDEAKQFVTTTKPNDDGEYEPDYEQMWFDHFGDPDVALDAAERAYERHIGRS